MGKVREFLDDIDPEGTPDSHARFIRLSYRAFVTIFIIWSLGQFKYFGFEGFAHADEVDEKVQAAVEPLRSEIGKIAIAQKDQEALLKSIRVDQVESKLREMQLIRCRVTGTGRDRMDQEIEEAQRQHRALTGERYPLPRCGDE